MRSGFVTLIGRTNAGKSSLLNYLLDQKISMVSHKQNATRRKILGIVMNGQDQAIFIDTPGLHDSAKTLNKLMVQSAIKSLGDADAVVFVASVFDSLENYEKFLSLNTTLPHIIALTKIDEASRYSTRLVIEDLVENLKEINCSVLGDCDDYMASVCEEPIKSGKILSYEDKYMGGSQGESGMQASEKRIPADLTPEQTARVQFLAGETFRVLSCHGVARVDVMIDDNTGDIYVNEINAIPGSLSFYLWEATKVQFDELMDKLVKLALKRKREAANKTVSYSQNIFALGGGTKGTKGAKGSKLK